MSSNKCKCGKSISSQSFRCKSCSNKDRKGTYKLSEFAKLNISQSKLGIPTWNKGKNHNSDFRIKNKPIENITAKKYGMRQDDWVQFSINLRRAESRCYLCNIKKDYRELDLHHKIPYNLSNDNSRTNLIVLCKNCHAKIHYHNFKGGLWKVNNPCE